MNSFLLAVIAAVTLTTLSLAFHRPRKPLQRTISSPRDTLLPKISPIQATTLPYPPNALPGARDVVTPYGVMRVYEWGPENGEKMLFIHGDATPAPLLGPIAHNLVNRGCRVMLFDLWGRGYSDTPLGVSHDSRLFGMQIFFAISSSPLSWTEVEMGGFTIVGFSLGGGIAMAFAADFYHLINSVILLAPGGIIRHLPVEYKNVLLRYSSLLPYSYLKKAVAKVLGLKVSRSATGFDARDNQSQMATEIPQEFKIVGDKVLDMTEIVQWQFDNHIGFVHSFTNTLQHGPIQFQHSDWRKVLSIIKGDTVGTPPASHHSKLFGSKILVIFGDADSIILSEELSADLLNMIGDPGHVEFKVVAGGHGFPVPSCDEVARYISDFCGLESGDRLSN